MIGATALAYLQTTKLDINHHPMSKLDDILLFIAIPAFIMDTTFTLVPAIANKSTLTISIAICQIVQVLIQTPFIIDGLRRCSNAVALRKKKPGRELVIFLTISNVSLWIFYTFSVKTAYKGDERYVCVVDCVHCTSHSILQFSIFHSSILFIYSFTLSRNKQIWILWIHIVENIESHFAAVDYVLSIPFVRLSCGYLETFIWASTVSSLGFVRFIQCLLIRRPPQSSCTLVLIAIINEIKSKMNSTKKIWMFLPWTSSKSEHRTHTQHTIQHTHMFNNIHSIRRPIEQFSLSTLATLKFN